MLFHFGTIVIFFGFFWVSTRKYLGGFRFSSCRVGGLRYRLGLGFRGLGV